MNVDGSLSCRCPVCRAELVVGARRFVENMDGTSGDAEVVSFTCPSCGAKFDRWRIPRLTVVEGVIVAKVEERWVGGEPMTA